MFKFSGPEPFDKLSNQETASKAEHNRVSHPVESLSRPSFMSPTKSSKMKTITDKMLESIMSDRGAGLNMAQGGVANTNYDSHADELSKLDDSVGAISRQLRMLTEIKQRDDKLLQSIKARQGKKQTKVGSYANMTKSFMNRTGV